jgi:dipeptidyl aminopeptidase/acylaminoacyl peptidase
MAANEPRLRGWGYRTDLVRYRARRDAFPDVLAAYDRLRSRVGAATPICAYGSSAGAQMALMLAVERPGVACVIAQAAPTELQRLSPSLTRRARAAFGPRLARWSPASYHLRIPLLLEQTTNDPIVPFSQMRAMERAAPQARTLALTPGPARWIHSGVSRRSLARSFAIERQFLQAAVAQAHG